MGVALVTAAFVYAMFFVFPWLLDRWLWPKDGAVATPRPRLVALAKPADDGDEPDPERPPPAAPAIAGEVEAPKQERIRVIGHDDGAGDREAVRRRRAA